MHQKQAPASLYNISDLGIISELGEEEAMRVSGGGAAKVFATTEDSGKYQASTRAYSDGFVPSLGVGGAAKVFATTEDSGKYQASTGAYSDGFVPSLGVGGAAKVFATTEDSGKYQASTGAYSDGFR